MIEDISKFHANDVQPFLDSLSSIYADMDREYSKVAAYYSFDCAACQDICCQTRFYHHTYLEYLFILEGFKAQSSNGQAEIKARALNLIQQDAELDKNGTPARRMCPLNVEKLCILYPHRPMICRLHGIPHEFQKGTGNRVLGPGCETFDSMCVEKRYLTFDRTSFYRDMAVLENQLRQAFGITDKIKMTIAEMLSSFR